MIFSCSYLSILNGLVKKDFKVFIVRVVMIACILPLHNCLALPNDDIEEGIEKENDVVLERINIKKDRVCLFSI